jgi:hypothetical protein
MANESVVEHRTALLGFGREGEHVGTGLGSDAKFVRSRHKVVVGVDYVDDGQRPWATKDCTPNLRSCQNGNRCSGGLSIGYVPQGRDLHVA